METAKAIEIWTENIRLIRERQSGVWAQRRVCAEELAELCTVEARDKGIDEVYSDFCDRMANADAVERAILCRHICASGLFFHELERRNLYGDGEAHTQSADSRMAYVKNNRSDEAYLCFSKRNRRVRSSYVGTFAEACEAVYDNSCDYCILPLENEREGRLYSFYSMIDKYELKICDTAEVVSEDGSDSITFGLVGRTVNGGFKESAQLRFEFSVINEDCSLFSHITDVVELLGGRIVSVGIQPVPYDSLRNIYYFGVELTGVSADALALYLGMEFPRSSVLGLYEVRN